MNSTARGQNLPLHILYKQEMPANRCKQCEQPLVEIDHYGERLTGCPNCNRWQAATGEWCRLAADDIIALRAIKAATLKSSSPSQCHGGDTSRQPDDERAP